MESLYTKYRPQTFADVVGQTHVVTTLEHAVLEGRTSHAYLFCGPRGTGKTTMARLLAKALMCEQGEGHLPDGSCEQCRLIAAGEHPDVYELDAASRTGVDNVREEIISRVSFAPVRGRFKMYIIDEVHMLTTAAFNALLKTLEEPPSHVVFVLCTTDPQKIPETILSRVQRFDFHAIGNADIQARLAYICEREGFGYDPEALELVVRHARGGMRDAISELEQLSVSGSGTISVDVARDVLGEVSSSTLERMSLAMANRDVPTLFAQVESLVEVGRDLLQFTRALAARLRDVYVVAAIGANSASVSAAETDLPAISREAQAFESVDRVARALQLLSDASTEMRVAPNQRLVLEVALTKIARPQAELTLDALADRVVTLERQVAALSQPAARREQAPMASESRKAAPAEPKQPQTQRQQAPAAEQAPAAPQVSHEGVASVVQPVPASKPEREYAPAESSRQTAPQTVSASQARTEHVQPPVSQAQQPASQARQPVQQPQPAAQGHMPAARPTQAQPAVSAPAAQASASGGIQDAGELQRRWKQVVSNLLSAYPQHGSLLLNATLASDDGQQLLVSLPKGSGFACRMLDRPDVRSHVDPAIAQVFGARKTHFAEADVVAAIKSRPEAQAQPAAPRQDSQAPAPAAAQQSRQQAPAQAPVQERQQVPVQALTSTQAQVPAQAPTYSQASSSQQPAQRPAPAQAPAPPMPRQEAPTSTPSYPAPWEPLPYDDDQVPYDDLDAAPYEEDYIFGTVDPAHVAGPSVPKEPQHSAAAVPPTTSAQVFESASEPAPKVDPDPVMAPMPEPAPVSEQAAAPEPMPEPEHILRPEPQPEPQAPQAPVVDDATPAAPVQREQPTQEQHAQGESSQEKPKAKRVSRQTGGVPNDIISMLQNVFGEGITYTELAPDETGLEDETTAALADGDGFEAEDEFADEPIDDADYEDDEDE